MVKTRGFAFEAQRPLMGLLRFCFCAVQGTRESTMLIPLADFLNHNMVTVPVALLPLSMQDVLQPACT